LQGGVLRLSIRAIGYQPLDVDAEIGATDSSVGARRTRAFASSRLMDAFARLPTK